MKQWKLIVILLSMMLCVSMTGCSWFQRPVELKQGQLVEIAKPIKVRCWINNKDTNKRELRVVEAQPYWWIVNPKPEDR